MYCNIAMGVIPGDRAHGSQNSAYLSGPGTSFFVWKAVLNIKNNSSIRNFNWEITPYDVIFKINRN